MQPPSPWDWIEPELGRLQRHGLVRPRREIVSLEGGRCRWNNQEYWDFLSNDYLGLAHDPRLLEASAQATRQSGAGSRASPLMSGRSEWHVALETKLTEFKRSEAAILFSSGYAANVGTICSLVGAGDEVYCDRLNHASLVDGCRLSGAKFRVYPHADVDALRQDMSRKTQCRRRLIVTDSLFSMDGDVAPLHRLAELAEEFSAMMLVDEAHATGVFGERGTGLVEDAFENQGRKTPKCLLSMGTLSKSLGTQGGFVTGSKNMIDWLWNTCRTHMFSTALPPGNCAAAQTALDIVESEPHRRRELLHWSLQTCDNLRAAGWEIPLGVRGPILPIRVGDPIETVSLAERIRGLGVLMGAIRPPSVPHGTSRLRISVNFSHIPDGVTALLKGVGSPVTKKETRD